MTLIKTLPDQKGQGERFIFQEGDKFLFKMWVRERSESGNPVSKLKTIFEHSDYTEVYEVAENYVVE